MRPAKVAGWGLVVTDGEPTAHLLPPGDAVFRWPPRRETITATVAEVDRLTRYGAAINVFMLGEDERLRRFMDAVARRNGGRVSRRRRNGSAPTWWPTT